MQEFLYSIFILHLLLRSISKCAKMASANAEVPLEHIFSSFVSQVHLKMDIDG